MSPSAEWARAKLGSRATARSSRSRATTVSAARRCTSASAYRRAASSSAGSAARVCDDIRAADHPVDVEIGAQPRERLWRIAIGVGEREIFFGACDALRLDGADLFAGGEIGREHLGEGGGEPGVGGARRQVAKA